MFSWLGQCWQRWFSKSDHLTLYVGNLPYSATRDDLNDLFGTIGSVESARIIRDARTRKSKGYGFITFHTAKDAKRALTLDDETLKGRAIRVRFAHSKPQE